VAVGEVITHPGDLPPRDFGFGFGQIGTECLHGLANLQLPDADGIAYQAV